ncbi:MAG TPA: cytochrome c biogenesis protein ResB, partial [Thermomicrobiales bacterium]|nr:cytochrome c biogenesis protein ResB [Thermomicrobiales bacterium]
MAEITLQPSSGRSPAEIGIDRVWRFFCSVRAAVAEIALLAVLVLIGTLRGSDVPQWIADAVPVAQPLVDQWYAWDVYRSVPFAVLLAVIAIAIAVCTINRVPGIWQTITHPVVRTSSGYLNRAEASATFRTGREPRALQEEVAAALGKRRYRVLHERLGSETHLYADKNRFTKLATFPFHLALILLLVGGIVASYYGFRDREFVIAEGVTREVGHGTGLSVQLNRFQDSYTPIGIAEQFRSNVTIFKDGEPVKTGDITVNSPLSYGTATFYQTDFGTSAEIEVRDSTGAVRFAGPVDLGIFNYATNADSPAGFVEIPSAGIVLTVVGPDVNPANAPQDDTLQLRNGQMWVQVQPLGGPASPSSVASAVVDQGTPVQLQDLTVTFTRETRHTLLQVAYNPGIPIFFIASVMMVAGLATTFYLPRRRLRGMITPSPAGAVLTLAPLARRDWSGKQDFFKVVESLSGALDITPEVKRSDDNETRAALADRSA